MEIIKKLESGRVDKPLLAKLLCARGNLQKELFKVSRQVRQKYCGDKSVVRGVVEISNYCRKNCDYCAMQYSNRKLQRYRLTSEQIFSLAIQVKNLKIKTVFLQSGEDPIADKVIEDVLPRIKQELKLNILLCLGNRSQKQYQKLKELGASDYILKFETSNPGLFKKLRHESLEVRLKCLRLLKQVGFRVGTGNIVGLQGQTIEDIVEDILLGKKCHTEFISSSPFIPNKNSVCENKPPANINLVLNNIAIWRILLKDALIPTVSALETIKKNGQLLGFNAGANIITVNFTPSRYREKYLIYSERRFIVSLNYALSTIKSAHLKPDLMI